jgi:hypothetical protein
MGLCTRGAGGGEGIRGESVGVGNCRIGGGVGLCWISCGLWTSGPGEFAAESGKARFLLRKSIIYSSMPRPEAPEVEIVFSRILSNESGGGGLHGGGGSDALLAGVGGEVPEREVPERVGEIVWMGGLDSWTICGGFVG